MPRYLAWFALPLCLHVVGCDDEQALRLAEENQRQQQQIQQLVAVQEQALASQQRALAELQAERDRAAQVQAEDRTLRGHTNLLSATAILLGSALAIALAVVLIRARRASREASS